MTPEERMEQWESAYRGAMNKCPYKIYHHDGRYTISAIERNAQRTYQAEEIDEMIKGLKGITP